MRSTIHIALSAASILLLLEQQPIQARVALYDNTSVGAIPAFDDAIGPRTDDNRDRIAQQFKTTNATQLSSVSVHLQRVGSPSGSMAIELWDGNDSPSNLVETLGTFDLATLTTSTSQFVSLEGLATNLEADSSYFVVVNAADTDIHSFEDTYRYGLTGRINDEESEGTMGAARVLDSLAGGEWLPLADTLGCHPSGACPNYLRMSVTAVPEPTSIVLGTIVMGLLFGIARRKSR